MALEIKNETGWHNYNVVVVSEGGMIVGTFADRTDAELFVRAREMEDEWQNAIAAPPFHGYGEGVPVLTQEQLVARMRIAADAMGWNVQPDTIIQKEPA